MSERNMQSNNIAMQKGQKQCKGDGDPNEEKVPIFVLVRDQRNIKLIEEIFKDLRKHSGKVMDPGAMVLDMTHGEGGMIPISIERTYTVHKSDKFKNTVICGGDDRYKNVLPLCEYMTNEGAYSVIIFDPPYSSQKSGHTATNCDLKKSGTVMKFNNQYGTEYEYTPANILSMVQDAVQSASRLSMSGGFLLIKCKDYKHQPYTFDIMKLVTEEGNYKYWGTYLFSTRDKVIRRSQDMSTMLVFERVGGDERAEEERGLGKTLRAESTEDYQNAAVRLGEREQRIKEDYAELLVHHAEMFQSHVDFVAHIQQVYNFTDGELESFLKENNMNTEYHFERNRRNGSILRAQRGSVERSKKRQRSIKESFNN